jgi:predicted N-formylglutamate amidohydrolase
MAPSLGYISPMEHDDTAAAEAKIPASGATESEAVGEPPPFEILNPDGVSAYVFNCDHASGRIPDRYGHLGLDDAVLGRHIAWDIGAADVTRRLSTHLDAVAVFSGFSRLLIDCNRQTDHPTLIPPISDGVIIPGNVNIATADRAARIERYFDPYHRALDGVLDSAVKARVPALVSVHSFTPIMNGYERPWHIGILWNRDPRLAKALIAQLRMNTDLEVGENEPYSGRDMAGFSIHHHGGGRGIPHLLIELRQDLIDTHHGVEVWANRLGLALVALGQQRNLFTIEHF